MEIEQKFGLELKNPSTREQFHMGGGTGHTDEVFIWSNTLEEWVGCVKIVSKGYFKNEAMEQIARKPKARFFKYTGEQVLTRGDYGVNVTGGHNAQADPGAIFVFDPDCGEQCWIGIDAGIECGDWVEITQEQHAAL